MNSVQTQDRSIRKSAVMSRKAMNPHFSVFSPRFSLEENFDPFINFDEFHMATPTFPPHPHAGFSVMTYLFEDSKGAIINRDSFGDHSRILPGGLHWTQAGRGAMHEEHPEQPYRDTHGLQLWVNHSNANRNVPPKAIHTDPQQIPEAFPAVGARVRVLAGEAFGVSAAFTPVTPIVLLDVHLEANTSITLPAPPHHTALLNIVAGSAKVNGQDFATHTVAIFNPDGQTITLNAGPEGLNALFGSGAPLGEEVVFGGPFVGGSRQDILATKARFARGEMGRLEAST